MSESARAIYASNFDDDDGVVTGVPVQKVGALPPCDLLLAGFPCQPYTAQRGKATRGFRDPRGQLFWHVVRLVCSKPLSQRPKALLLENVKGLAEPLGLWPIDDDGRTGSGTRRTTALDVVLAALSRCGSQGGNPRGVLHCHVSTLGVG